MRLGEQNGLYMLDARVAPRGKQTSNYDNKGFGRQANPLVNVKQRARSVSPCDDHQPHNICPVEGELGDQKDDENTNEEMAPNNTELDIEDMANKYEELRQRVEEHFDQENHRGS